MRIAAGIGAENEKSSRPTFAKVISGEEFTTRILATGRLIGVSENFVRCLLKG